MNFASRTNSKSHRSGFTLLELISSLTISLLLMNVCLSLFLKTNYLHSNSEKAMNLLGNLSEVDTDFRKSVRESSTVLENFREYKSTDQTLIIEQHEGKQVTVMGDLDSSDGFVVERWTKNNSEWFSDYRKEISVAATRLTFDTNQLPLVKMTIHINNESYRNTIPEDFTAMATLREGKLQ